VEKISVYSDKFKKKPYGELKNQPALQRNLLPPKRSLTLIGHQGAITQKTELFEKFAARNSNYIKKMKVLA
jgi:hypothetical protein